VLAGSASASFDFFGNLYTGLSVNTGQMLTGPWVGLDDLGDGAYGADSLQINALGAAGDLAPVTAARTDTTLGWLDSSCFLRVTATHRLPILG